MSSSGYLQLMADCGKNQELAMMNSIGQNSVGLVFVEPGIAVHFASKSISYYLRPQKLENFVGFLAISWKALF